MEGSTSHLILTAALSCVAAIPNHAIRYTALGLTAVCALLYNIHLRSPSTNLDGLIQLINRTDIRIRYATTRCPRYHFALAEQTLRLLRVDQSASHIHCRIRALEGFSWTKYRQLFQDIAACIKRVEAIGNAVEHIIEAEHQRRLADEMNEVQSVLAAAPAAPQIYPPTQYGTESEA
ncbi:hypothetical protein B0H16DRAFT_1891418 [Mycena metata]|uniref:Uncharacterized protein n=1 Tax=Mycena metata TaxID=1033252 RepID=A0AAD7MYE2_9AGAR|nr:hypothetical protein B0H16DRAFT_1891418 [Mycena metata]